MRLLPHTLAAVVVVFHVGAFDMTPHGARVLRSASSSVRRSIGAEGRCTQRCPQRCPAQRSHRQSSWALETASPSSSPSSSETTSDEVLALEARIESLVGRRINLNSPKQVSLVVFGQIRSASRSALEEAAAAAAALAPSAPTSSSSSSRGAPEGVLSPAQREIASLVLRHRDLTRAFQASSDKYQLPDGSPQRLSFVPTVVADTDEENSGSESDGEDSSEVEAFESDGHSSDVLSWSDRGGLLSTRHHERAVHALFERSGNLIHRYWEEPLLELNRPSAKALLPQLDSTGCPMGFDPLSRPMAMASVLGPELQGSDALGTSAGPQTTTAGKKGSFLSYCRDQKNKYPDAIILTRCK
jgi:hypothetical protein